jgi:hypothetical protein
MLLETELLSGFEAADANQTGIKLARQRMFVNSATDQGV